MAARGFMRWRADQDVRFVGLRRYARSSATATALTRNRMGTLCTKVWRESASLAGVAAAERSDGDGMRWLLVVVAAVSLLVAAGAEATIIVQRGIAGVELHMTRVQVRSILGKPTRTRTGRNLMGPFTQFVYPRVTVVFQRGPRVTALTTSSPLERTQAGVGAGSTESELHRRVPHVACYSWKGRRDCILGKYRPDRTVTVFTIKRGRVSNVIVGVVLHRRLP